MIPVLFRKFSTAAKLLTTDPKAFRGRMVLNREKYKNRNVVPQDQRTVTQELAPLLKKISDKNWQRILLCGDSAFQGAVRELAPDSTKWKWISLRGEDVLKGATPLSGADFASLDAILVGGRDVKTAYPAILKILKKKNLSIPVLWEGADFEFGGSTIPVPTEAEDADFYLFNHYGEFFGAKEPVLVNVRVRDWSSRYENQVLLSPGETFHLRLSDALPVRVGPAVFEVFTHHPQLTRKRHRRWRVWSDLHWKGSITSLHGGHDYGPATEESTIVAASLITSGKIVATIPNYEMDMQSHEIPLTQMTVDGVEIVKRNQNVPLEEVVFEKRKPTEGFANVGLSFRGYGCCFWYLFEEAQGGLNTQRRQYSSETTWHPRR